MAALAQYRVMLVVVEAEIAALESELCNLQFMRSWHRRHIARLESGRPAEFKDGFTPEPCNVQPPPPNEPPVGAGTQGD